MAGDFMSGSPKLNGASEEVLNVTGSAPEGMSCDMDSFSGASSVPVVLRL